MFKHIQKIEAEIERQRAQLKVANSLIAKAELIFARQLGYFENENENHKDREYIDYLLGLGRDFNSEGSEDSASRSVETLERTLQRGSQNEHKIKWIYYPAT